LLYGTNNQIDQVVLDVLIRKAAAIRRTLGLAVPVPVDPGGVIIDPATLWAANWP
jgi:hypothetical protein